MHRSARTAARRQERHATQTGGQSPGDASRTPSGLAEQRAAHGWLDDPPLIRDDPVSARLAGPEAEAFVRGSADQFRLAPSMADGRNHLVASVFDVVDEAFPLPEAVSLCLARLLSWLT